MDSEFNPTSVLYNSTVQYLYQVLLEGACTVPVQYMVLTIHNIPGAARCSTTLQYEGYLTSMKLVFKPSTDERNDGFNMYNGLYKTVGYR
jgi:hypothetical protein